MMNVKSLTYFRVAVMIFILLLVTIMVLVSPTQAGGIPYPNPWPDGTIYFHFGADGTAVDPDTGLVKPNSTQLTGNDTNTVISAMEEWEDAVDGLHFVELTNPGPNDHYVNIINDSGIVGSQRGYQGIGNQYLSLDPSLSTFANGRNIHHELGHIIGLGHEHQRPDRNDYMDVDLNVVSPLDDYMIAVNIIGHNDYDYASVMHYPEDLPEFEENTGYTGTVGGIGITQGDIGAVKWMYEGILNFDNKGSDDTLTVGNFAGNFIADGKEGNGGNDSIIILADAELGGHLFGDRMTDTTAVDLTAGNDIIEVRGTVAGVVWADNLQRDNYLEGHDTIIVDSQDSTSVALVADGVFSHEGNDSVIVGQYGFVTGPIDCGIGNDTVRFEYIGTEIWLQYQLQTVKIHKLHRLVTSKS